LAPSEEIVRNELRVLLADAVGSLVRAGELPEVAAADAQVERTRDPTHGDFSSNVAMVLAKPARRKPRELAELIVRALPESGLLDKVEIAGPGFINFFVKPQALQSLVTRILAAGESFACDCSGQRGRILVEYVSANPTGPMHVGHGRGAAYGDSVCNILAATGWEVHREYYINDAGRQADILGLSVWLRYLELCGECLPHPRRAYPGEYIRTSAARISETDGARYRRAAVEVLRDMPEEPVAAADAGDAEKATVKAGQESYLDALLQRARALLGEDFSVIRQRALQDQLVEIRNTLDAFGVRFDQWCSERELVEQGYVQTAIEKLDAAGHVYELDGAKWLRTSEFGDEKDRVLYKADGSATYFANDLAYHVHKLERGFRYLMDVWGADHHGYIARVRAAIEMLTGRKDALQVQLMQFVTLSSGRMGKRSGNFVTLKELIADAGKDATRFFYLARSHDQHLEFDIDLARSQSNENPVYYVQYAHARICSVFRQLREKGLEWNRAAGEAAMQALREPHEQSLLSTLSRYGEVLEAAGKQREPHQLAHYLLQLANDYHAYYNAHRFITAPEDLRDARLNLCAATRLVLRSGLAMLGVAAPETM
jgi:arginyl-tRNA synthetase